MSREFIKTDELIRLCYDNLVPQVANHKFKGIIGIPRSGMMLASAMATLLHVPLYSIEKNGMRLLSGWSEWGGGRMRYYEKSLRSGEEETFLVVDDWVWTGRETRRAKTILNKYHPEKRFIFSTVYIAEDRTDSVDFYSKEVSRKNFPYCEWHFMSSFFIKDTILDIDGLLCEDAPMNILKDTNRYVDFITKVSPSAYIPRRLPCHCILTGRSEKYRAITEQWLNEHGILYNDLQMYPETGRKVITLSELCRYKSNFFSSSKAHLLVESHCGLARCINKTTGKRTVCLPEGRIFQNE